jgi:hypothetical protein
MDNDLKPKCVAYVPEIRLIDVATDWPVLEFDATFEEE